MNRNTKTISQTKNTVINIEEIIKSGNMQALINLFKIGAVPPTIEVDRQVKLLEQFACEENQVEILEKLLSRRDNINAVDTQKRSLLHIACAAQKPNLAMIQLLLNKGVNINAKTEDEQRTAFLLACRNPNITVEILTVLLQAKDIDATIVDNNNENCFHALVANPNATLAMCQLLFEHDQKKNNFIAKNKFGQTPLYLLSLQAPLNYDVIEAFIQRGAINTYTENDETVLHALCNQQIQENDLPRVLKIFSILLASTSLHNYTNSGNMIILHAACNNPEISVEIVKQLCIKGCEINNRDSFGETPLHLACKNGRIDVMRVLIQYGADVNLKDKNGNTPLIQTCFAAYQDEKEKFIVAINFLIENKANINDANKLGDTAKKIILESHKLNNPKIEFLPFCNFDNDNKKIISFKDERQDMSKIINEIFNSYFSNAENIEHQWAMDDIAEGGVQITLTSISPSGRSFLQSLNNLIQQQHGHINKMFFEENETGFLQFCCVSTEDAFALTEVMTKLAQTKTIKPEMSSSMFDFISSDSSLVNFLNDLPPSLPLDDLSFSMPMQPKRESKARQRLFVTEEPVKIIEKNRGVIQRVRPSHEIIEYEVKRKLEKIDNKYQISWELSRNEDNRVVVKIRSNIQNGISCLEKLKESIHEVELKEWPENTIYQELEFTCSSPHRAYAFAQAMIKAFNIPCESTKRKVESTPFWNNKETDRFGGKTNLKSTRGNKIRKIDTDPSKDNNNVLPDKKDGDENHISPVFNPQN